MMMSSYKEDFSAILSLSTKKKDLVFNEYTSISEFLFESSFILTHSTSYIF